MKISVVVPALNEVTCIDACLESVARQRGEYETVVVDGGSYDGTPERVAGSATVLRAPRGRARQMNAGARATAGEVLLFLHADSVLHPDAFTHLRRSLADGRVVGGTFSLRFDSPHPLLRAYAWFTRFRPRLFHYGDQGIFVRRATFERLGGFREMALMEDVDFLRRLRRVGSSVLLPVPVTTSARRFLARGLVRQQALNATLVSLYALGMSAEVLARWYGVEIHEGRRADEPALRDPGSRTLGPGRASPTKGTEPCAATFHPERPSPTTSCPTRMGSGAG